MPGAHAARLGHGLSGNALAAASFLGLRQHTHMLAPSASADDFCKALSAAAVGSTYSIKYWSLPAEDPVRDYCGHKKKHCLHGIPSTLLQTLLFHQELGPPCLHMSIMLFTTNTQQLRQCTL